MSEKPLLKIVTIFLLTFLPRSTISTCATDNGCQVCNFYVFLTPMGLYGFYNCDQCYPNHTLNNSTHVCDCNVGYYDAGNSVCKQCDIKCTACTDGSICTSCDPQYNRVLVNRQCQCANGYQSKNGATMCSPAPNILLIVLSSVGSFACVILSLFCCWLIRFKKNSQQIHQSTDHRDSSRQAQVNIYVQGASGTSAHGMTTSSLWNAKQYQFKSDETCSICLETQPLFITNCGHYFHFKCIEEWMINHKTCPNCNGQINEKHIKKWCDSCKKVLMPIIRNVMIKRAGKKKRDLIKSAPVEIQLCDQCQNKQLMKHSKELFS